MGGWDGGGGQQLLELYFQKSYWTMGCSEVTDEERVMKLKNGQIDILRQLIFY